VPANPNVAHVINLSLGGLDDAPCPALYDALLSHALSSTGTRAIVAAAGNESDNATSTCRRRAPRRSRSRRRPT
jgi:subtilisin family serine protease